MLRSARSTSTDGPRILAEHERATVVHLGAGLDFTCLASRPGPGVTWYDVAALRWVSTLPVSWNVSTRGCKRSPDIPSRSTRHGEHGGATRRETRGTGRCWGRGVRVRRGRR